MNSIKTSAKGQFLSLVLIVFGLFSYQLIQRTFFTNLGAISLNHFYDRSHLAAPHNFLEKASSISSNNQSVTRLLGLTYLLQAKPRQAQNLWNQHHINLNELLIIAESARFQQRSEFALSLYETVIDLDPQISDSYYYKAEILLEKNQLALAKWTLEQGLTNTQIGSIGESDFYLSLGEMFALGNDEESLETAVFLYQNAIKIDDFENPTRSIRAHYLVAEIYRRRNKVENAITEYQWVLKENPNHYGANVRLAQLVWNENKNIQQAEGLLLRAIDANAQEKGAYRVLGAIYAENGRVEEAISMYKQILLIDPVDEQALAALATINEMIE